MKKKRDKAITTFDLPNKMIVLREVIKDRYEGFLKRNYIEPQRRNYFSFFLVITGSINHSIDFKAHSIHEAELFFIAPSQVYLVETAEGISGISLLFKPEILGEFEKGLPVIINDANANKLSLSKEQFRLLHPLLITMLDEYSNRKTYSDSLLINYLNIFLTELSRIYLSQNKLVSAYKKHQPIVTRFNRLLFSNWDKDWTVSSYAKQLHITPGHLNDIIKKSRGKKASACIQEKKMLEIKRLLFYSNFSIKEIAYMTGFTDPAYFNRFFKKCTGKTPQAFKDEFLKKFNASP